MKTILLTLTICLISVQPSRADGSGNEILRMKYENLLLFEASDFQTVDGADTILKDILVPSFRKTVRSAKRFNYELEGIPAYFDFKVFAEDSVSEELRAQDASNRRLDKLFSKILPLLAYAYQTPGENPHYKSEEVRDLYLRALEYCYGRGLNEHAWTTDHAGRASARAEREGLVRNGGDFSAVSLQLGGFIQSIFLMREPLAEARLLDKYRAVIRNLVVNSGTMYQAFHEFAREDAGITYGNTVSEEEAYFLNADGFRLFVDYFWPYFLLIEDPEEKDRMTHVLKSVIAMNIAKKGGTQDTIKPDGVGFHHNAVYVGGYSSYTFEAFAQLLYLISDTDYYTNENLEVAKEALETFRVMSQKYTVSPSLSGRLVSGDPTGASVAVTKATCFLAHPDGFNDSDMQARFIEFFDPGFFLEGEQLADYYKGRRGVPIRGLGIYRLISDVRRLDIEPASTPSGAWIKPYAAAGFHRRDDWLVTARGFSRYFWDYEGPLNKQQNSFGQNWSGGLLQVFATGDPVSATSSGYDLDNGWDWYHVPGTTASHYPIERRTLEAVEEARKQLGIVQRSVHRNYSTRTFVGGVSLGEHGLFVNDLEAVQFVSPTDLTARKSYFFVGDKVLAMGSHISGGTETHETHTTLFQTRITDAETVTWLNGRQHQGLGMLERLPAGQSAAMTDNVGNSYFLAASSADLVVSRQQQDSMTPQYEPTQGDYAQAWIDHGIKPQDDHYQYVVIPADTGAVKLKQLADNPSSFYRVVQSDRIHLVHFPSEQVTAYAFYEEVCTPEPQIVKCANLQATVMTQEQGDELVLAASVPDLGWETDLESLRRKGLSYASRNYIRQEAKAQSLVLVLRGKWRLEDGKAVVSHIGEETQVELTCKDGLTEKLSLIRAE